MDNGTLKPLSCEEQEEFEREKIRSANAEKGNLTGPHCDECNDKGYTYKKRNDEIVIVECGCMKKRRSVWNMEKSGLGDLLEYCTFDRYQTKEPWQKEAKRTAMDYTKNNSEKWFVASGAVGSGKTHICTAICGGLLKAGLEVRYMLWRDSATKIKAVVNDYDAYNRMLDPLKSVKVLYIDDFFKGAKVTAGDTNLAFELLNARYNSKKLITIISTELSIEQILDIDEAVGSRIYERSKGYYLRFEGKDKNFRLRA